MSQSTRISRFLAAAAMTAALVISAGLPVAAQADEAVLEELIALEETKLTPWYGESSVETYMTELGDETTYFDDATGTLLKGEEVSQWLAGFEGLIPPLDWEITNPHAAVRGDVAVFAFNIDMADPETGDPVGQWMVTKVLERTDDGWKAIHGHFGMPPAPPAEPEA